MTSRCRRVYRFDLSRVGVDGRGYKNTGCLPSGSREEFYFVTRMKVNALDRLIEARAVRRGACVFKDQIVFLLAEVPWEKCPCQLCRVEM